MSFQVDEGEKINKEKKTEGEDAEDDLKKQTTLEKNRAEENGAQEDLEKSPPLSEGKEAEKNVKEELVTPPEMKVAGKNDAEKELVEGKNQNFAKVLKLLKELLDSKVRVGILEGTASLMVLKDSTELELEWLKRYILNSHEKIVEVDTLIHIVNISENMSYHEKRNTEEDLLMKKGLLVENIETSMARENILKNKLKEINDMEDKLDINLEDPLAKKELEDIEKESDANKAKIDEEYFKIEELVRSIMKLDIELKVIIQMSDPSALHNSVDTVVLEVLRQKREGESKMKEIEDEIEKLDEFVMAEKQDDPDQKKTMEDLKETKAQKEEIKLKIDRLAKELKDFIINIKSDYKKNVEASDKNK